MSVWEVTLRICCWVETLPPGQGAERRERGWRAGHQAAICPQDTHKYPCKLQFKRNQYKWQVANATIWGSNEGVLGCVSVCALGVAYTDNSKPARLGGKGSEAHTYSNVSRCWMDAKRHHGVCMISAVTSRTPCYTRRFSFTEGSVVPSGACRRHGNVWLCSQTQCCMIRKSLTLQKSDITSLKYTPVFKSRVR